MARVVTVQVKNSQFVHDFMCNEAGSVMRRTHGVGEWIKVSHREEVWTHDAMCLWLVDQGYHEVAEA